MTKSVTPEKPGRKVKKRVKSGCQTCKIRKVKCDEHFPVCHRCLSTGRVCDGYGVWGGGGNLYWRRQSSNTPRDILEYPPLACISTLAASTDELASFDWFKGRTIIKLPGSYLSDFWTKNLLQASHSEQAVWHAIMALSFTHRVGFVKTNSVPATKLEQSTLRHLIKAVRHLSPHFTIKDKSSFRVVLIVCLVFVVLDLLRGHFVSAQVHLRNGLNILAEAQSAEEKCNSTKAIQGSQEPIDVSIGEAFFRLHTQVQLLQHIQRPQPCILSSPLQPPPSPKEPPKFTSYTAVWRSLDHLMNEIFRLSTLARQIPSKPSTYRLTSHRDRIKQGLDAWKTNYITSLPTLHLSITSEVAEAKAKVHGLVSSYHTMLTIMTETSLHQHSESVFDRYTPLFVDILNYLSHVYTMMSRDPNYPDSPFVTPSIDNSNGNPKPHWIGRCDMAHTIIDVGWMIPLFYTAIKCRDRRVRRRAVRLLESTNHREGIWDAKVTACIARRVMEIEEGDFYDHISPAVYVRGDLEGGGEEGAGYSGLDLDSALRGYENGNGNGNRAGAGTGAEEPMLPESSRIRDLEAQMEGDPLEKVILFGSWEGMDEGRVCIGEYLVPEQRWL
ncbi:hypothetical protein BJY04DRAFT_214463 [Aspergillus karnatakaensis]|uniref:Zn(II)2Cys6 transcription factor n=1 Tax=Aspergillus karnatakaensis TaxID=1810916 RepID=UPI003CCDAF38